MQRRECAIWTFLARKNGRRKFPLPLRSTMPRRPAAHRTSWPRSALPDLLHPLQAAATGTIRKPYTCFGVVFGSSHQFIYECVDCVEEVPSLSNPSVRRPASKVGRSLAAQKRFRPAASQRRKSTAPEKPAE